ncbi:hypothetical protein ACLMJK_000006 [Lecanora helva]
MAQACNKLQRPEPLRILTLDSGGLQAISTLLILNKVLEAVAQQNGEPHKKPRPCDVFDTIAGIGTGGWLAILLGRFRMDITTCLAEWYKLMLHIVPKSKPQEMRLRILKHSYIDTELLVEHIDLLTKMYNTGDQLFEDEPDGARTHHVFVAALDAEAKGYKIFRNYETGAARRPWELLEGPKDPENFTISRAFRVTGAAKYFTPPCKEHMASSGTRILRDENFPCPHAITELALHEMWACYGGHVPMSMVLNIGPGLSSEVDVTKIACRFPWGLNLSTAQRKTSSQDKTNPTEPRTSESPRPDHDSLCANPEITHGDAVIANDETTAEEKMLSFISAADELRQTIAHMHETGVKARFEELEGKMERHIKAKIMVNYQDQQADIYHRLAPTRAPEGTSQNDSRAPGVALACTLQFLELPQTATTINTIARRLSEKADPTQ